MWEQGSASPQGQCPRAGTYRQDSTENSEFDADPVTVLWVQCTSETKPRGRTATSFPPLKSQAFTIDQIGI